VTVRHDNEKLSQAQTQRRKDEAVSKIISIDVKCIDLARHFLSNLALAHDADVDELAQRIQATVEEFIDVAFNIPEPPEDKE
jgi:TPP-dependent pyruvate/acetoin dehydrogenase alpha subunit